MPSCSAFGCTNRSTQGYLMKVFPRNPSRRALWAAKVKRKDWVPNDHSYLCEEHFDESQWKPITPNGKRRLKDTAVPTIFCFTSKKNISHPSENISFQSVDIDESADLSSDNEPLIAKIRSNYKKDNAQDGTEVNNIKIESNEIMSHNSESHVESNSLSKPKIEFDDEYDDYSNLSSNSDSYSDLDIEHKIKPYNKSDIFEITKNYSTAEKVKALEKHISNLQKELNIANKGLARRDERIKRFKKKLRKARIEKKRVQTTDYEKILRSVFNDDQIDALYRKSTNYMKWCNDTVEKAMKYKTVCGVEGYNLIKNTIPLPSIRTLQRHLEKIRDFPDNKDDISSLSSDNRDDEPFFRDYK